jgi:uncharacterized protein YqjF (DUF2071 family)
VLLVTYEVPAIRLAPLLPPHCQLDTWTGRCYASLVALRMERVRIRGWAVPGLTAFSQVNLRFYARHEGRAAVCFVQEMVPSRLLAAGARWLYGEPFRVGYIRSHVTDAAPGVAVEYHFGPGRPTARLRVLSGSVLPPPESDTFAHWVKERTRGCRARPAGGRLRTFDVTHSPWAVRQVTDVQLRVDFAELYGAAWAFLDAAQPASVLHAEGSEVSVSMPS